MRLIERQRGVPFLPAVLFLAMLSFSASPPATAQAEFRRGDANDDGKVDMSDAISVLGWLFLGAAEPGCVAIANVNPDQVADLSDAIYLLSHLFLGGPRPLDPYPVCGQGRAEDYEGLGCETPPVHCQPQ